MEIECPHEQNDHCPASELERCDCCWKWIHLQDLQQAVIEHLIHPPPPFFLVFSDCCNPIKPGLWPLVLAVPVTVSRIPISKKLRVGQRFECNLLVVDVEVNVQKVPDTEHDSKLQSPDRPARLCRVIFRCASRD